MKGIEEMGEELLFPIMGSRDIPWAMLLPHAAQAQLNHGQSLSRLACRGGLTPEEALAILMEVAHFDHANPIHALEALVLVYYTTRPPAPFHPPPTPDRKDSITPGR